MALNFNSLLEPQVLTLPRPKGEKKLQLQKLSHETDFPVDQFLISLNTVPVMTFISQCGPFNCTYINSTQQTNKQELSKGKSNGFANPLDTTLSPSLPRDLLDLFCAFQRCLQSLAIVRGLPYARPLPPRSP